MGYVANTLPYFAYTHRCKQNTLVCYQNTPWAITPLSCNTPRAFFFNSACSVKVVRSVVAAMSSAGSSGRMAGRGDAICRSFNAGLCTYPHCRFRHECSSCGGSHPEVSCGRPRPYAGSNKGNDKLPRGKP